VQPSRDPLLDAVDTFASIFKGVQAFIDRVPVSRRSGAIKDARGYCAPRKVLVQAAGGWEPEYYLPITDQESIGL